MRGKSKKTEKMLEQFGEALKDMYGDYGERQGKKQPWETEAWTVAIANLNPLARGKEKKIQEEIMNRIKKLDGFIGIHPIPPRGTLLIFKTENDAKRGRNEIRTFLSPVGDNICKIYIDKRFVKGE